MPDQAPATRGHAPAAGDVVEGPVGSARLRNPAGGPIGADLDALPPMDVDPDPSGEGGPIDGSAPGDRQDRDHVGVDWDLTQRDRG